MPSSTHTRRPGARNHHARSGRPHPGREAHTPGFGHPLLDLQRSAGNRSVGSLLGGGIPSPVREQMETAFDTDLSAVRLRVSADASRYDARAMTRGSEITFAPGHLDLGTTRGRTLLAHEIGHAVQQSTGRVRADGELAGAPLNRDRALERQAHDTGERIARGGMIDASLRGHRLRPGPGSVMQRDVDPEREAKIKALEKPVFFDGYNGYADEGITDTYKLGLGVYVDHVNFNDFYRARTPLVAERRVREAAKQQALARDTKLTKSERSSLFKSWQDEQKEAEKIQAARDVLGSEASDEEIHKLVTAGTGHTWVEFQRYEGARLLGKYTFGFSTLAGGVTEKEAARGKKRGVVKNPDNYAKPSKGKVQYHTVTAKHFKDSLKKVFEVRGKAPRYELTGFNCTSFAKTVLEAGGITFPSAGLPVGKWGIGGTVYSPNTLYTDMGDVDGSTE